MLFDIIDSTVTPQAPEIAIGIDLGTSHSVVAFSKEGNPFVINVNGQALVPSIVAKKNNSLCVAAQGIGSFKRGMQAPRAQLFEEYTPIELSAAVLKHLKQAAEAFLGETVSKAVITVPAYFDETARQATKEAALLAGLSPLRLVNEPTAAALAYGLDQQTEGTYAVYDLGGGTFDISILKMQQGIFQVISTAGDTLLGGDDIDAAIADYWQTQNSNLKHSKDLMKQARQAKEALSDNEFYDDGAYELSQETLKLLTAPFIERTLMLCEKALEDAKLTAKDLSGVILVGGSTRLTSVQEAVEGFFGLSPLKNLDPDTIVAKGAALQAETLTRGSHHLLIDVTPLSLGIETMGGLVEKIIPRNSPLPIAMAQEFTTYQAGQTAMSIHVVQGEREHVDDCRSLGKFILTGIPPLPAGAAKVRVTFQIDADGLLTVSACETLTGEQQSVMVQPTYGLSALDFEEMLKDSKVHGAQDIEKRLLTEAILTAEQTYRYVEQALQEDAALLTTDEKSNIDQALHHVENALRQKERTALESATKTLMTICQPFAEKRLTKALTEQLAGHVIAP